MLEGMLSSFSCYMRDKLLNNVCQWVYLQSDFFVSKVKESDSLSQRNVLSCCLSSIRHLGVDLITEFTPSVSPQCCLKQRSVCKTICPNLGIFSSLFGCAGYILSVSTASQLLMESLCAVSNSITSCCSGFILQGGSLSSDASSS